MTEVWFRNPVTFIRECAELCAPRIVWDRGLLRKQRIDPVRHIELHYPSVVPYRILLVGDQGTAELQRGRGKDNPVAVYPTWEYGVHTIDELEDWLRVQRIDDRPTLPPDERAVPGQSHRVVIIRPPDANRVEGKAFIGVLRDLQYEYPDAIVHYHGTYSFRVAFGNGFGAADIDPVADAAKGRVVLGSGKPMPWEDAAEYTAWVELCGARHSELAVARNRTMFNMRSADWAGANFNENHRWMVRPPADFVPDTTSVNPVPVEITKPNRIYDDRLKVQEGDKFLCDRCSVAPTCKYFRDGGVCAIPDSDARGLARHFRTRDSEQIIDGLGRLIERNIHRAERALDDEQAAEELDPHVTKLLNDIFTQGVKLAKLVDPNLASGTKVQIAVGVPGQVAIGQPQTPQQQIAAVIAALEAQGIDREDIDGAMVSQYIMNLENRAAAIEAQSR